MSTWDKEHPIEARAMHKKWAEANPEKMRASRKKWQDAHPDNTKNWRAANPEKVKKYSQTWRDNHPEYRYKTVEERKERAHKWYTEHRERVLAWNKAWKLANPERFKEIVKACHLAHAEQDKVNRAIWRAANKDLERESQRAWSKAHPERVRALRISGSRTRRQRLCSTIRERIDPHEIFARDKWKCRNCGIETPVELCGAIQPNAPTLDHIIPIALGGPHTITNLQCLCRKCNTMKATKYEGQLAFL